MYNTTIVASIPSMEHLDELVDALGSNGIDHGQISTLAIDDPLIKDDRNGAPLTAEAAAKANPRTMPLITIRSIIEVETLIVVFPAAFVLAFFLISKAVSDSLAVNLIVGLVAGGLVGYGAYLVARKIGGKRERTLQKQIKRGGIIVFVTAMSEGQEEKIRKCLARFTEKPLAVMSPSA